MRPLVLISAAVMLVLAACGGTDERSIIALSTQTPGSTAIADAPGPATRVATATATTSIQPLGTPSVRSSASSSGSGGSRIVVSVNGNCRLTETGSEIVVSYTVKREGSAGITRIRFLIDGQLAEEIGPTDENELRRETSLKVPDGSSHAFQVLAEAGSNIRSSSSTTVRCAAPTAGPRS